MKESFTTKFYWMRFLSTALAGTAVAMNAFVIFFYQEMGLNLGQVGMKNAISSLAIMSAMYFMAIFIDRWHPLRICVYGAVFGVVGHAINMVWIFVTLPADYFFWLNIDNVVMAAFLAALVEVAGSTCQMRIFPRSRYGQFCSGQALIRAGFAAVSGIVAGLFIDMVKWMFNGSDYAYRFIYLWMTVFAALSAFFLVIVYREWNKMGGDKSFHPPAPWSLEGVEELPIVPTIGPQSKHLKLSFAIYDFIMGVSVISLPFLMLWMFNHNEMFAFKWYGLAVLPLALAGWGAWMLLRRRIAADMLAAKEGRPLMDGLPHHGMLVLIGCKFALLLGLWLCQVFAALYLNNERGAVVFGIANGVTNFMIIGGLYLMCRIERGFATTIDGKPGEMAVASGRRSI